MGNVALQFIAGTEFLTQFDGVIDYSIKRGREAMANKKALVCGAGGFIGSHMVKRLRAEGYWVRGADLKHTEYSPSEANDFMIADLRLRESWEAILDEDMDEVYQFAADMGGAGYIFTGENDAHVMHNSAMINLHAADFAAHRAGSDSPIRSAARPRSGCSSRPPFASTRARPCRDRRSPRR